MEICEQTLTESNVTVIDRVNVNQIAACCSLKMKPAFIEIGVDHIDVNGKGSIKLAIVETDFSFAIDFNNGIVETNVIENNSTVSLQVYLKIVIRG